MIDNRCRRHLLKVELETTRQYGYRNFLRIGSCENELDMIWRLLQGLEHGVKCVAGQLMHLVNHVNLILTLRRGVHRPLEQLGHVVDATVGCCVQLDVIDVTPAINLGACRTDTTWGR